MNEREIIKRLEAVIDRWLRATPAERSLLLHEKIRLEDLLERVRAEAKVS